LPCEDLARVAPWRQEACILMIGMPSVRLVVSCLWLVKYSWILLGGTVKTLRHSLCTFDTFKFSFYMRAGLGAHPRFKRSKHQGVNRKVKE